jgi:trans-aconitate methyltransferase
VAPARGDVIADIGCGTGTQLRLLARSCPSARLIGINPDDAIRRRARAKLAGVGTPVELLAGYARDSADLLRGRGVTKVLSSLMFHQVPLAEKRSGLAAMYATLAAGGSLHVADYGLQRTPKMRSRFRMSRRATALTTPSRTRRRAARPDGRRRVSGCPGDARF